jgi:N-methylhydantoinase B/oxoprolinase/acetone carboxylase alpha subunit
MSAWDPVTLEVFRNLFYSVAEEMGVTLCRTSFSPNIK